MKPVLVCWAALAMGVADASASTYYEQGDAGQLVPTAAVVPVGTTKIVGSLGPTFEADLYRLTFTQPLHVTFQVVTTGQWFDEDMTLFDAVGHPIAVSDFAFSIDLAAGTYHLGLTDWDAAATDATGRIIADDYSNVLDTTAILGGWVQTGWPWRYGPYEINIIPEPTTLLLLALGGVVAMRRRIRRLGGTITPALVGVFLLSATSARAVNIETVPVGNPGNPGDTRFPDMYNAVSSFGSVAYTYNIGRYEVTAGQYTAFLNAVAGVDTYGLYNTTMSRTDYGSGITRSGGGTVGNPYTYTVASSHVNRPVNLVSWGDSARFANWLHNNQPTGPQGAGTTETGAYTLNGATTGAQLMAVNRNSNWRWAITSEDEWYKAAYHKNDGVTANYWDYPTSSNDLPGRDLNDVSGNNANYYASPYPIQSPYYTTVAGEFQNSDSPYGTFDQSGNVCEWNEAVLLGAYRGFRGGSFYINGYRGELHASSRRQDFPTFEGYNVGFRVVQVPEPATLLLLALGGLAVSRKQRKTATHQPNRNPAA